jgi:hypothetical protein
MARMDLSFFTLEDDELVPTFMAQSMWSGDQMHGVAVSGALARGIEHLVRDAGVTGLRPARVTVDLFRAATMSPSTVTAHIVRQGGRLLLVDAVMAQQGEPVARASAIFLRPGESVAGEVWEPEDRPGPPPTDEVPPSDEPRVPFLHSSAGWSQRFSDHQNASRKTSWNTAIPIVAGERVTPFQGVASTADAGSMVTNWGSRGVEHINTDITVTFAREPDGVEVGLRAADRVEHDGIAVGTATLFDRAGTLGTVVVTSLANARRTVDLGGVEYTDDGGRTVTRV